MWPLEIDLFEPFQKAIECTRDFRVHWLRFWDEKVREAYLAQREALFRTTVKKSEYNPHAVSVAEKRIKSMDTILEWLACGRDSSVDPNGEIAAVYACLKKKQQQAPILTLTKTIEKGLLKRKLDDYLEEAEEEVAKAERKVAEAEAEQKVLEAEIAVELASRLYRGTAYATFKEMIATNQAAAEVEQGTNAAVADPGTKQIVAEGLGALLAASVAQPLQLAAREMEEEQEAEKAVLESEISEDDNGRNLEEDIANWLLDPRDAKDSTGQFRMMDSRFPAKENQDPSERASEMALKIRFLRNSYPDWLASMKAQDEEDIMLRSMRRERIYCWLVDRCLENDPSGDIATLYNLLTFEPDAALADIAQEIEGTMDYLERLGGDWIESVRTAATLCSKKTTGVNAETATSKSEKAPTKRKAPTKKKSKKSDETSTSQKTLKLKRASTNEEARARKTAARTNHLESWTREGAPSTKKAPISTKARASKEASTRKMSETKELEAAASKGVPITMEAPTSTKVPTCQEDAANAKASRSKTAPTNKKLRTSEEALTSRKPENDGNDGTRGQSAKPDINKGKSCKRSRGDGQDSKKTKRNRRPAAEITPEGSANGDQVRSGPNPPIGVAPVILASDRRFYGALDVAGEHAGMMQDRMPFRHEVRLQHQTPARHEAILARYPTPVYQEGFLELHSGGRSLWLSADPVPGGRVEWRVSPEAPLYNSHPPNRSRIPGDSWPY
jgi:hypothetical protein